MTNVNQTSLPGDAIPPDNPQRRLSVVSAGDPKSRHISIVGNTYTILLTGEDTDGRYCLIDMNVPPGGGPPSHRHDFEEMFTLIEGEIEFTFRGETSTVRAGSTINVPANAPHSFRNKSSGVARMLCICTPAGQEGFFMAVGDAVASRVAPAPQLTEEDQEERKRRAEELAPKYRTELLPP
ncbi:MAG: cupin domain-containing protein [Bradyrhizobiaceae bacterium]|nr:cupin domain-containing protein [Bradyrhizobiaceae bacterium]